MNERMVPREANRQVLPNSFERATSAITRTAQRTMNLCVDKGRIVLTVTTSLTTRGRQPSRQSAFTRGLSVGPQNVDIVGICGGRIAGSRTPGGNSDVRLSLGIVTIGIRPAIFRDL